LVLSLGANANLLFVSTCADKDGKWFDRFRKGTCDLTSDAVVGDLVPKRR
jgi:hypothetical protein